MEGTKVTVLDDAERARRNEKFKGWSKVNRASINPGPTLPGGMSKYSSVRNPELLHGMRNAAAKIAVDMERGQYIKKKNGQAWSGPYNKWEIAEALGYNARSNSHLPKIFNEPHFSRYVEYERTVRDAGYRMAMREAMPMLDPIISGFMIEALRRVLIEPEKIADNVLFTEMRKFMTMKGEYEGAFNAPEDVKTLILNFNMQTDKLPEEARQKAVEIFKREMASLMPGSRDGFVEALATVK